MRRDDQSMIVVLGEQSLVQLDVWLGDRDFNEAFPFLRDRKGQRMIGLNRVTRAGDGNDIRVKCGLVVIGDGNVFDQALNLVNRHKKD